MRKDLDILPKIYTLNPSPSLPQRDLCLLSECPSGETKTDISRITDLTPIPGGPIIGLESTSKSKAYAGQMISIILAPPSHGAHRGSPNPSCGY